MAHISRYLLLSLLLVSAFACQKMETIPTDQPTSKTLSIAKYPTNTDLINYLLERIEHCKAKGHVSIFVNQEGGQAINPDRQWLEAFFTDEGMGDRAFSAQTFAYVEAVGESGQILNNSIQVYRSGTTIHRGTLMGVSSPAGQGANTNTLRYLNDIYCNDYWGNFSHTGLSSIEIDVFLRTSTTPWLQRHATVTDPEFSGYIIKEFCLTDDE